MALKPFLSKTEFDSLPETKRDAYKASGDGYVLDVEGIDNLPALTNALENLRVETKKLKDDRDRLAKEAAKYEGVDPEKYRALMSESEEKERERQKKAGEFDAIQKQTKDNYEKRIKDIQDAADKRAKKLETALYDSLIESQARAALAKHGGDQELLLPHVKSQVRIEETDDGFKPVVFGKDGNPRLSGDNKAMDIDALVVDMKANKSFARGFDAEPRGGSGKQNGSNTSTGAPRVGDQGGGNKPIDKMRRGMEKMLRSGQTSTGTLPKDHAEP